MLKRTLSIVFLLIEIGGLLLITKPVIQSIVSLKGIRLMEWIEINIPNVIIALLIFISIFIISIGGVIFILMTKCVKNMHLKVFAIWLIFLIIILSFIYLFVPFCNWA